MREVPLNELDVLLEELSYPVDRDAVRETYEDVVLLYADGTERLVDVLDRTASERFESPDDLSMEVFSELPVEAVGEPGQSEGEG
ncbi:DUF5789 family protein [Salinarchaeum chitinilyticum]